MTRAPDPDEAVQNPKPGSKPADEPAVHDPRKAPSKYEKSSREPQQKREAPRKKKRA